MVTEPTGLVVMGEVPVPLVVPPEVLLPEAVPPVADEPPTEVPVVPVAPVPVDPDEALPDPELLLAGAFMVSGPVWVDASWLPDPSAMVTVMPYDEEAADGDHCNCTGKVEFGARRTLACWASVAPSLPVACTTRPVPLAELRLWRFILMMAGIPTCGLTG